MIKDSGERVAMGDTGFVRDRKNGVGRFDLMPWNAMWELAKHCEEGALKYGERNIDKGAPQHSLIDSAIRHLAKYLMGWNDEDHLRAALWNVAWAKEQELTKPEMQDIPSRIPQPLTEPLPINHGSTGATKREEALDRMGLASVCSASSKVNPDITTAHNGLSPELVVPIDTLNKLLKEGKIAEVQRKLGIKPLDPMEDFYRMGPKTKKALMEEWGVTQEEPVDWTKVAVDTPILVRNSENESWQKRYFARYEDGFVYAWLRGQKSTDRLLWEDVISWEFAKLAEE